MTTPACPLTEMLESDIDAALKMIDGVTQADIDWVWDPPWDPSMMSDAARAVLNR
jgi:metal-sulfur cluster biosynthetic enzyme